MPASIPYDNIMVGEIQDALLEAFPTRVSLEEMTQRRLNVPLDTISTGGNLRIDVFRLITEWAYPAGKVEALIQGAYTHKSDNPKLRGLYGKYIGALPVDLPPYARCYLGAGVVFVNRNSLRRALSSIHTHSVKTALIVRGKPRSGRTWTHWLIRHEMKRLGYNLVWVDLLDDLPPEPTPADLALVILGSMGLNVQDLPVQGEESADRWVLRLLTRIVGQLQTLPNDKTWWIVIDGFSRGAIPPTIYDFLMRLAAHIVNSIPRCRLALLGYDDTVPAKLTGLIYLDEITPPTQGDIEAFFRCALQEQGLVVNEEVIRAAANEVYTRIDFADAEHMTITNELIKETLDRLGILEEPDET